MGFEQDAVEVLKKHAKALAKDMVLVVAEPALQKVVSDSKNPYDDILFAATKEPIKAALLEQIEKF